jgi:tetratricopeptide (TPR) repeat protein
LASQKEKYLASAQKFIQKGQFDRAIKDYEQIVAADPKEIRHRQKLAELLARCNRKGDSIREYQTIAKYYDDNGFFLKAIAVYKQLQKLDSLNIEISYTLAALNEKQGLVGNALSEYKSIFDHYEKAGLAEEALKTLEMMEKVDPENLEIQIKLAETHYAAGQQDKAYQEYTKAALILKNRGNDVVFEQVSKRIQTLFPGKMEFSFDLLAEQLNKGVVGDSLSSLKQMLQNDPGNHKLLSLLAEAYRIVGDKVNRKSVCQQILELNPDDKTAKIGLLECYIEDGDVENSLSLIQLYAGEMQSNGLSDLLEKYYTTLQNLVPYDTRILEGLKALYETTGDQAKLADVLVSLNILNQNNTEPVGEFSQIDEITLDSESAYGDDVAATVADFPWEEQIDLSNISTEIISDRDVALAQDDVFSFEPESVGDTVAEVAEIDFPWEEELELALPGDTHVNVMEIDEFDFDVDLTATDESATDDSLKLQAETGADAPYMEDPAIAMDNQLVDEESIALELDDLQIQSDTVAGPAVESNDEQQFFDSLGLDTTNSFFESALEEGQVPVEPAAGDKSGKYGFDGVFSEFKKELDQQVEQGDTETHYNLGIAYKEMGLYDDAINEFQIAAADPLRKADCLTLQGICFQEKGDLTKAEEVFLCGIERFALEPENLLNIKYELALLYETAGRKDDALHYFRDVFASCPGYRNTASKVADLHDSDEVLDLSNIEDIDLELEEVK